MAIERREFLAGLLALLSGPAASALAAAEAARAVVAGAVRNPDGSFSAVLYDLDRGLLRSISLPGRGHDATVNPTTREVVVFARRPGTFALAFGHPGNRPPTAFTTPPTHHFYGHGVFSPDGRLLYTTEHEIASGQGRIGVWDAMGGYRRIGAVPSGGVGPHDLNLLSDGKTLVVANGGIATSPDTGRRPLNLATMSPSLSYIDRQTGDLTESYTLPPDLHRSSIRHLEVAAGDTIVFGCQFMGARTHAVDLIGLHRRGRSLRLISGGPAVARALRYYVSSIAVDRPREYAAVTSSRGQAAVYVDIAQGRIVGIDRFPDISGIAAGPHPGRFVATGGGGEIGRIGSGAPTAPSPERAAWAWDNHLISVPLATDG